MIHSAQSFSEQPLHLTSVELTMIDCGVFNNADLGVNAGVVLGGWLPELDLLDEAVGVVVEDAGFARPPRGMRSG